MSKKTKKKLLRKEKPRMNEFIPQPLERPFKESQKYIESVKLTKLNINKKCEKDIEDNKGFYITNENPYADKKETIHSEDGLFSPKYGIDTFSSGGSIDNVYKCVCGNITGAINEGDICPECETPVAFYDADLSVSGYIPLGKYPIINPACYLDLLVLIGKNEINHVLKYNPKYDVDGFAISEKKTKANRYHGIGMIEFYNKFDEIAQFYRERRKKEEHYQNLMRFKGAIFTNYINPYSSLLRPHVKDDEKVQQFPINKAYGIILANSNILTSIDTHSDKKSVIEPILFSTQEEYMRVFHIIVDNELNGKNSLVRGKITSARIDFSGRCVIRPGTDLHVDEINLPYLSGVELLRPLLVRTLSVHDNISERKANSMIDKATLKFSKRIWILMNWILQNSEQPPRGIIQRSPSLLLESMRMMRIKSIKADYYDVTMDLPIAILKGMNADQ